MQSLWSRAAQFKSTCRCPSCLITRKHGLSRTTTTDATQLTRLRYGNRFAFYSSSILASAAFVDSYNKDKKQEELSQQIAEARRELIVRQEEQDRRLAALGRGPGDLNDTIEGSDTSPDEAWYEYREDSGHNYDKHAKSRSPSEIVSQIQRMGPGWYKYRRIRRMYTKSVLDFFARERQEFVSIPTLEDGRAEKSKSSTGPPNWSFSPELDRRVRILRDHCGSASHASDGERHSVTKGQMMEDRLGDQAYDLRILKMEQDPDMEDLNEHARECILEHLIQTDLYLQSQQHYQLPDEPDNADKSQRWSSLIEWTKQQRKTRHDLGFKYAPGISIQELQSFMPAVVEEITESNLLMNMIRGVRPEEAWRITRVIEPLTAKGLQVMAMVMYKLLLCVLQVLKIRENALRQRQGLPPIPTEEWQILIDFWSYHIDSLKHTGGELDFPSPPFPAYTDSLHFYNKEASDQPPVHKRILHSQPHSHETKMIFLCMHFLHARVPIDIHTLNDVLIYLCRQSDWELAALFIELLEECKECKGCHLRPNEITVTWVLKYYRRTGQRQGFQSYVAKMYGRKGHLMVRDPMLMIPYLQRPKFVIGDSVDDHLDGEDFCRTVELKDQPYQPFPTDQRANPKIYEKASLNGSVYCQLIRGALTFDYIDDAFTYFVEMIQHGWSCPASVFEELLKHFTDTRDWIAGSGIWARRYDLSRTLRAKAYSQVLKLCIVCGKRAEFYEILNDGMTSRSTIGHSWPVATLETLNYSKGVVSLSLSWAIGLEQELRKVTRALASEVENVRRDLDNACGDTVLSPIQVNSETLHGNEESHGGTSLASDQLDDASIFTENSESAKSDQTNLGSAWWIPPPNTATTESHHNKQAFTQDAIADATRTGSDQEPHSQQTHPDWSFDHDTSIDDMYSDTSSDHLKELETLLLWRDNELGRRIARFGHDQDYVVVPATYRRERRNGPKRVLNTAGLASFGDATLDTVFPVFHSVKLDENPFERSGQLERDSTASRPGQVVQYNAASRPGQVVEYNAASRPGQVVQYNTASRPSQVVQYNAAICHVRLAFHYAYTPVISRRLASDASANNRLTVKTVWIKDNVTAKMDRKCGERRAKVEVITEKGITEKGNPVVDNSDGQVVMINKTRWKSQPPQSPASRRQVKLRVLSSRAGERASRRMNRRKARKKAVTVKLDRPLLSPTSDSQVKTRLVVRQCIGVNLPIKRCVGANLPIQRCVGADLPIERYNVRAYD